MLGDMMISKKIDLDGILNEAWMEIEVKLGTRFVTPIYPSMNLPHHTSQYLNRIHAYLATAIVVMGQGGANPEALTYSDYLRNRAYELLGTVLSEGSNLDGLSFTTNDPENRSYAPSIFVHDEGSPFDFWESQVHNEVPRAVWRPSTTFTDPNAV